MPSDEELKSFIVNAQGNQKLALCLVSRKLRVIKRENFDFRAILREEADIAYLKDNLNHNQDVKQIVEYLNTNPLIPIIEHVDGLWVNKDFKNQNSVYDQLKSAAAQAAAAAAGIGVGGQGAGTGGVAAPPPAPPQSTAAAAVAPPPPAADGSWLMQSANMLDRGAGATIAAAGSLLPAVHNAVDRIVVGRPQEALPTLVSVISRSAEAGAEEGLRLEAFSAGAAAAVAAGGGGQGAGGGGAAVAAGAGGQGAGGQGDGGGGPGGGVAAAQPPAGANQSNPQDDEEKIKKLLLDLQRTNLEERLEVFDENDKKKISLNQQLDKILGSEEIYKKNKDSAFIHFISHFEEASKKDTFLPHVTKTDFNKILKKDSFAITASQYAVACKVELGNEEKIAIGKGELSNQCFIDVQDYLNHTRIFLSKDNFTKLEQYKENLVQEFKELLENDGSRIGVSEKEQIEDIIFKFGSIKDVKSAKGVAPVPPNTSNNSLASKVGLSPEKINEYAQKLADQFWQRKLMKGDLSVEAKNTSSGDYDEAQRLGHIKIERPKTDKDRRIKVYKFGSDGDINLTHVNLGIDDQIMQIKVKNITDEGVTGVEYFKQNPNEINNFNLRVYNQKDLNETVKKAKVDVFVEDSTKKEMRRFKIRGGVDNSKPITTKANKIVTPLSAEAPKIFTLEKDNNNKAVSIGEGTIKFIGTDRKISHIDIKIAKDKNGKFVIEYGENKMGCASYLSNYRGGFLFNHNLTSVESVNESFILQKEKKWNRVNPNLRGIRKDRHLAVQVQVLDPDKNEISTVEIRKVGSRNSVGDFFCSWRARNQLEVKEVAKKSTVPPTTFQPQNVLSPAPVAGPRQPQLGP